MKIPKFTLDQLYQSLSEYNPTTNEIMGKIASVLQPLAMAIVAILFLVELANFSKKFDSEQGGMTPEVLMNIALKYAVAAIFIASSGILIDTVAWFGIQASKWIDSLISSNATQEVIPAIGKVPFWQKPILFLFEVLAYIFVWLSSIIGSILIWLRSVQLYIYKAIAPILIAFFVSDELRSIAVGFFKGLMALALQGALIVLIVGLIPILSANELLSFNAIEGGFMSGAAAVIINILKYVVLIVKYIAIMVILLGSQNMAKKFMGAM